MCKGVIIYAKKLIFFVKYLKKINTNEKMGASSSLLTNAELDIYISYLDIYISYPIKTEYIGKMIDTLQKMDLKIMESSLMIQSRKDFSISEISKYMEIFIEKTKFIYIFISKETIKSVTQIIEMNEIIDKYPTCQMKMIYFMMDSDYTPITNVELKSIVKENVWYPVYDEDTIVDTTNKILTSFMTNPQ